MIYLDNSSTTRQDDRVTDFIAEISRNDFGNPSSLHRLGMQAEKLREEARERFAATLSVGPSCVTFNSGGTEGDETVLLEAAKKRKHDGNRIVISAVEHPAVMESAKLLEDEGFDVVRVGVDKDGVIDMDALREAVNQDTILVSVMTVNNETGAVMPVGEIADIAHAKGAWMHTDSVQAYGKMDLKAIASKVDFITVSSHKIHGPKGTGALYQSPYVKLPPFIVGGGQEKGRRSGTENMTGIAGFGLACEIAEEAGKKAFDHVKKLQGLLKEGIKDNIPDVLINSPDDGLPYVLNVSFLGTRGEVILHTLEQDEIYVSTGSACSSNKKGRSYVLAEMGRSDKEIEAAIRFSLSRYNTEEEMEVAVSKVAEAVERFRKLGAFR